MKWLRLAGELVGAALPAVGGWHALILLRRRYYFDGGITYGPQGAERSAPTSSFATETYAIGCMLAGVGLLWWSVSADSRIRRRR